jgi:transcriptional regulator with XRE-family HTH domain
MYGLAEQVGSLNLTERVRARLSELHEDRRFSQTKVAKRLGVTPSAINRTLRGEKALTLEELEVIADEAHVPIAELIAEPGSIKQVSASEAALLRYVRSWPKSVQDCLLEFLRYWADEPPVDLQTRQVHEYWRRLGVHDRMWIFGILQMVREGLMTPEIQEGLSDRIVTELRGRKAGGASRKRKGEDD